MQTRLQNPSKIPPPSPLPARIVLTGFMGAGKTTVGRLLAERLAWAFFDLDQVIVESEDQSIATLFAERGEAAFRELERAALQRMLSTTATVLALGGGALETEANREMLRTTPKTRVIFLEAPLSVLLARCETQATQQENAVRPVLADPALLERYARRLPHYRAAHHTVTTANQEPAEILEKILAALAFDSHSISPS